ncbi:MAG TPA: EAL domain-containing protein [Arcobacter sp.]|jgi:diguanylate cyclase (GGDEF)-like protein|nr:EAL domain-containing protein [Arcobacter sp.]
MDFNAVDLSDVTILYCEDEEDLRQITSDVIRNFTKHVYLAENGQEGLDIFHKHAEEIDLIITDVNMPEMNGLEMAKAIKEINSNIPIIVATAFSNSSYLLESIEIGIDKYVLKPIDIKKLFKVMKQSLLYHELQDLYRDNLTHIGNRNALLKYTKQNAYGLGTLIDIDDFSLLNELYGEDNGDKILVQLKNLLESHFNKENYICYRAGADQFSVLTTNKEIDINQLKIECEKFVELVDKTGINLDNGNNINISITIGIAQSDSHHIFEDVQRVLNVAKKKFVQIMIYDSNLHDTPKNFEENLYWIKKLKDGLFDGHFKAFYQPIVDTRSQEIVKYEALIRYVDDNNDIVPPYKFLPVAKKAKLYNKILQLMLEEVLNFIKEKQKVVSLNISFDDIKFNESQHFIDKKLSENTEHCKYLHFELLETEEIENFDIAKEFIERVQSYGCKVGVDDFGAGYSNFNMLEALNVDFVKIDGSLIKKIDSDENQEIIVDSIANYTKRRHLTTVAEFVSNEPIYEKIKSLGIDMAQGWHFGQPVAIEDIN